MRKILIIDDESSLRHLVQTALKAKGFDVLEAESGNAGIEAAQVYLPDLILLDVMMPKMDGYRTLAYLRQNPMTTGIPCILITGRPNNAGMRQGMSLGADDYLPKPFSVEELYEAVDARFKKQQVLQTQAEKKLADLRSNISLALPHELFTPLSGIIGFSEILGTDASAFQPHEIADIGKAIHTAAKRLYRLVENFLIYAQIELLAADPQKVAALRQSKTTVTHDILDNRCRQKALKHERETDLTVEVTPGSAAILEEYLSKIVDELIENALKFSDPKTPIKVSSAVDDSGLTFTISDQGRGLTPEHVASIGAYMQFERKFYEQQGSGLGLAIAQRLTELHGGSLKVQSVPNEGTTVTVRIPPSPPGP